MKVTRADLTTITAAAAEIDGLALDLRMSSSIGGRGVQWDAPTDKEAHDRKKALAVKLYELRERLAGSVKRVVR